MTTLEIESMTLPTSVLKNCIHETFVETGSYDGRTIQQALSAGFKYVHSIELSFNYYRQCVDRFNGTMNVHLYHGDSEDILPQIVRVLYKPATFWLDAHIQENTVGLHPAPVLHELVAIRNSPIKNHTIMIDDIRLMGNSWWHDINLESVKGMISSINPMYTFERVDSKAAKNDILIARVK